jgi:integrase
MQTRPYDEKNGRKCWLSRTEQSALLDVVDERPRRWLALSLGLHGLRSDEIVDVEKRHFRRLDDAESERYKLVIPDGKTGKRETPVTNELRDTAVTVANTARLRQDESLVGVSKKTLRDWIAAARETLADDTDTSEWHDVGMHDLRRTWATDTFYTLAFEGVPIAEELTMGWGGWAMTSTGRETFRNNYLGPEPDHVAANAMQLLD